MEQTCKYSIRLKKRTYRSGKWVDVELGHLCTQNLSKWTYFPTVDTHGRPLQICKCSEFKPKEKEEIEINADMLSHSCLKFAKEVSPTPKARALENTKSEQSVNARCEHCEYNPCRQTSE